jgi:hypothetical protein
MTYGIRSKSPLDDQLLHRREHPTSVHSQEIVDDHRQSQIRVTLEERFTGSRDVRHDVVLRQRVDEGKDTKGRKHLFQDIERSEAAVGEAKSKEGPSMVCGYQ